MAAVMETKAVAFVGSLVLAAGWALSMTTAPPSPASQERPAVVAQPSAAAPATPPSTTQLRVKLRSRPPVPRPTRNPFTFGSAASPAQASGPAPISQAAPLSNALPAAPVEPYTLAGMASTGEKRTAIFSGGGSMHFVTVFDVLPNGDTVVRIDDVSVTLADHWGNERRLRLR